jgi:hypothetical protein
VFDIQPSSQAITITNLYSRPLNYTLCNDTRFFTIDTSSDGFISKRGKSITVIVKPNIPAILQHKHLILRDKYIEEHLTLYNRDQLNEKYLISLRFSTGALRFFYLAPGTKTGFAFSRLEECIIKFLQVCFFLFFSSHCCFCFVFLLVLFFESSLWLCVFFLSLLLC